MKTIFLTGRLVADPEIKLVKDDEIKVANFRLANNESDKDNAEYFDVCCWDKLADFAEARCKKGNKVFIQGTYNMESYQDKDDKRRYKFKIIAQKIEFAG